VEKNGTGPGRMVNAFCVELTNQDNTEYETQYLNNLLRATKQILQVSSEQGLPLSKEDLDILELKTKGLQRAHIVPRYVGAFVLDRLDKFGNKDNQDFTPAIAMPLKPHAFSRRETS
ncbi:MAG: hypothetical protein ACK53L_04930, partial [Pirellulaceae bacterium]